MLAECPIREVDHYGMGGRSTSDGAPDHGPCSVASIVSLVIDQGGTYDAAAMAQRSTVR